MCYAELHESSERAVAVELLHAVVAAFPYRLHTVLTDNGIQFANRAQDRWNGRHFFGRACDRNGAEHRLTKVGHPWTNGQVDPLDHERMNRTLKEATVKRYHYGSHAELREHLEAFLLAYNYASG